MTDQRPKLLIWGAGGHARVVAELAQLEGRFQIVGLLDDVNPGQHGSELFGLKVLGGGSVLSSLLSDGVAHLVVAIGSCSARQQLNERALAAGFSLPVLVHPRGFVSPTAELGPGTVVGAGAIVGPGTVTGRGCIINTSASVDHDCRLGDAVHIAPGAHLGGTVTVGTATWVGLGSSVLQGVQIGAGAMVGAGSVVTRDIPPSVVAFGSPAKVHRPA